MDATLARAAVADAWSAFVDLLRAASPAGLDAATRCEGWAVRDLVDHVRWGVSMEAEALRLARAGEPGPATGRSPAPVDDASLADAAAAEVTALLDAFDALLADVDAAGDADRRAVPLAAGTFPLPFVLGVLVMEAGVHTDDLRHALTGTSDLDVSTIDAAVGFLAGFLPLAGAAATERPAAPLAVALHGDTVGVGFHYDGAAWAPMAPAAAPPDATLVTGTDLALTLLLLGRIPADDPRLSTVDGAPVPPLKRWLPGP